MDTKETDGIGEVFGYIIMAMLALIVLAAVVEILRPIIEILGGC